MRKIKDLEQLKYYQAHYQQVYASANQKGKLILQLHIKKLERLIQKLSGNQLPLQN